MKSTRGLSAAIKRARKRAKHDGTERFVVFDDNDERYTHCDLYDLHTFYDGYTVHYCTDE